MWAGIAASDSLCAARLGEVHRGADHGAAADLLGIATADGVKPKAMFLELVDVKDEAHYGLSFVSQRKARDAVRWATLLVERALDELER